MATVQKMYAFRLKDNQLWLRRVQDGVPLFTASMHQARLEEQPVVFYSDIPADAREVLESVQVSVTVKEGWP